MKNPIVDIGTCTLCHGCIDMCPSVFRLDSGERYIEVADLDAYPVEAVNEAIKYCPVDAISWE